MNKPPLYLNTLFALFVSSLFLTACGGSASTTDPTTAFDTASDGSSRQSDKDEKDSRDENSDNDGSTPPPDTTPLPGGQYRILGFNDLGMHCADLDYSVFTTLPPFNVVHAQVIETGKEPRILGDGDGVRVEYVAVADASGSITTTSQNGPVFKTNFWDINPATGKRYVDDLFGLNPPPDEGLLGQRMPGFAQPFVANDPMPFAHFDRQRKWFAAEGIPLVPVDDNGMINAYPLMQVRAIDDRTGEVLASTDVVVPVAAEADCQNCHARGEIGADPDRHPNVDFVLPDDITDPNSVLQAAKINILRLHDAKEGTRLDANRPVLCAGCHYSLALDLNGAGPTPEQQQHATMSAVMHRYHGELKDTAGNPVFPPDGTPEQTCYQCHPGKVTQCLRGAMGGSGLTCQNCHGGLLAVGGKYPLANGGSLDGTQDGKPRRPWLDLPRCQACHTGDALDHLGTTLRLKTAYDPADPAASPRLATNRRFAENRDTLYRNSRGHGGVGCEGCHGSTHAIWPNANPQANDNVTATQLQGHSGTVIECTTCHGDARLGLTLEGPHGMHPVNDPQWNKDHEDVAERNKNQCRTCHGVNGEGTVLSRVAADRTLQGDDHRTVFLKKGTKVSCDLCHENKLAGG